MIDDIYQSEFSYNRECYYWCCIYITFCSVTHEHMFSGAENLLNYALKAPSVKVVD